ncbi:hypothetical protein CLOSCI_00948 [[Clostridium] scindens ATCC 35704]|nr:hypothetical protein CLOSCI_00948 [[Clostridium] scindens ATCC 35704]
MTYPQTPEIIAGGNGCAFHWKAEKLIFAILKRKNAIQSANLLHSTFCFSRLPGVSHKFYDISLWATAIFTRLIQYHLQSIFFILVFTFFYAIITWQADTKGCSIVFAIY